MTMCGKELIESGHKEVTRKPKRQPIVVKVRQAEGLKRIAVAPDDDIAGWRDRLKTILATSSPLFVQASLQQLIHAAKLPGEVSASTTSVSAALEIVASLKPENEAEAAMAIHIACLNAATLNVLGKMHGISERNVIAIATASAKLARAYQLAMENYNRLKNGVTQVVRVERVDVQPGANAIVGIVHSSKPRNVVADGRIDEC